MQAGPSCCRAAASQARPPAGLRLRYLIATRSARYRNGAQQTLQHRVKGEGFRGAARGTRTRCVALVRAPPPRPLTEL
jgi:hypothetical protein